jgi:hypothetical protein
MDERKSGYLEIKVQSTGHLTADIRESEYQIKIYLISCYPDTHDLIT